MGATDQSPPTPLAPPTKRRGDNSFPPVIWGSQASASCVGGTQKACFWSGGHELESVAFGCSSLHSKATSLLHGRQQLLIELLIRFIRWNVNPIKAGVGLRKVVCVGVDQVDGEEPGPCRACRTLQSLEALERDPSGPGHELQEPGPPLLVEGLHSLPEPPDDVAVGHAVLQPRVGLPVAHVDFIQATDDQL